MGRINEQVQNMRAKADYLDRFADFFEEHDQDVQLEAVEVPVGTEDRWTYRRENAAWLSVDTYWFRDVDIEVSGNPEMVKQLMAATRRHLGGLWTKDADSQVFELRQQVEVSGVELQVTIKASRDAVCEAVVVGTKTVEKKDPAAVAAADAARQEAYASIPKVEVEEPVVEWRCAPILTDAVESPA